MASTLINRLTFAPIWGVCNVLLGVRSDMLSGWYMGVLVVHTLLFFVAKCIARLLLICSVPFPRVLGKTNKDTEQTDGIYFLYYYIYDPAG